MRNGYFWGGKNSVVFILFSLCVLLMKNDDDYHLLTKYVSCLFC